MIVVLLIPGVRTSMRSYSVGADEIQIYGQNSRASLCSFEVGLWWQFLRYE